MQISFNIGCRINGNERYGGVWDIPGESGDKKKDPRIISARRGKDGIVDPDSYREEEWNNGIMEKLLLSKTRTVANSNIPIFKDNYALS